MDCLVLQERLSGGVIFVRGFAQGLAVVMVVVVVFMVTVVVVVVFSSTPLIASVIGVAAASIFGSCTSVHSVGRISRVFKTLRN